MPKRKPLKKSRTPGLFTWLRLASSTVAGFTNAGTCPCARLSKDKDNASCARKRCRVPPCGTCHRSPKAGAKLDGPIKRVSVLDCGSPLPLFIQATKMADFAETVSRRSSRRENPHFLPGRAGARPPQSAADLQSAEP